MLYSNLLDLWSRTSLNVFYLNIFYFFWTNLWYLYLFFFYLVFIYNFFSIKYSTPIITYTIIIFFLCNYCIYSEILFTNVFNTFILVNSELLNVLLNNSVNNIHPFLLYSSLVVFFIPLLSSLNIHSYYVLGLSSSIVYQITPFFNKANIFILVALYLGSWWALQEGSWGGWWNWDASEFLGLIVLYLLLKLFHINNNLTSVYNLYYILIVNLSYLFIYFFMLQLNFTSISHNFGFSTLKFLNTELLLLVLLLSCLYNFVYIWFNNVSLNMFFTTTYKYILNYFEIIHYTVILLNMTVLLSLISFFLNILLNFNFFFSFINFSKLLFFLFFFFYQHFMYMNLNSYASLYLLSFQAELFLLFLNPIFINFNNFTTHYLIYWLFFLSLLYNYSTLNDHIHIDYTTTSNYVSYLSLNCSEIELFLNLVTTSTSFEGKSFELIIHNNFLHQVYLLNATNWNLVVTTIDQLPTLLNSLLTITIILLTTFWCRIYNFNQ